MEKVFCGKYKGDWFSKSVKGSIPRVASWGARIIMNSVHALGSGLRRTIGTWEYIDITGDLWVAKTRVNLKESVMGNTQRPMWVSNLISENREWKAHDMWRFFEKEVVKEILAIHIPRESIEDACEW